jgi:hypothetical protein
MGRAPALIAIAMVATGCHDGGTLSPDAQRDAPPPPIDADLVDFSFTGHFLDWDSIASAPCPITGATWTVTYAPSRIATTDASGAFTVLLRTYLSLLDVAPPAMPSTCSIPASSYTLPGIAVIPPSVVLAGGDFVARSLTTARIASFYAALGAPFDPTCANLVVHVDGLTRAVAISSAHAPTQAFDGTTWAAGDLGADVFFPNITLAPEKMTTVTVAGGAVGTGSVPLAAGSITYMTVVVR